MAQAVVCDVSLIGLIRGHKELVLIKMLKVPGQLFVIKTVLNNLTRSGIRLVPFPVKNCSKTCTFVPYGGKILAHLVKIRRDGTLNGVPQGDDGLQIREVISQSLRNVRFMQIIRSLQTHGSHLLSGRKMLLELIDRKIRMLRILEVSELAFGSEHLWICLQAALQKHRR